MACAGLNSPMPFSPLPIDAALPELIASLKTASTAVVQAPPGAGKTTRVPPALVEHGLAASGQVLVLQPRRVAARSTARRMAEELNCQLGHEVGYQIRFERRTSARTRIVVMTEGILLRRLLDDPFLENVAAVALDEFHERHLDTDLALAMVRRVQQTVRPDLKLIVMSATLQADPLVAYLGNCPLIHCDVRRFPVQIEYLTASDTRPLPEQAAISVLRAWERTNGDTLVFQPGVREIQQTISRLQPEMALRGALVLPLYGDLSAEQQDRVFAPSVNRKVIVATNVAETSITIPGVTAVIDTGWARTLELDARTGLNTLELRTISQAAAEQRAGRAGRTGPGLCLRLWTEASHRARPAADTPEIHRVDLSGAFLALQCWGERDVRDFPWFDSPRRSAIEQAEALLRGLDAIGDRGVTPLGREMVRFPVAPRLARLVIAAVESGIVQQGCLAAALLSDRDPFQQDARRTARHASKCDIADRVAALSAFARHGRLDSNVGMLHAAGADRILQAARQLERIARDNHAISDEPTADEAWSSQLARAVLAGFPDRVVRRREPHSRRGIMVGGRGVFLAEQSAVWDHELFVGVDVDAGREEAVVRMASGIEVAWLSPTKVTTQVELEFDAVTERVQSRRRARWYDLVLDESPAALPEGQAVAAVLAAAACEYWERIYPPDDPEVSQLVARIRCLRNWMPEQDLPAWTAAELQQFLPTLAAGCRSLVELRAAPWAAHLRSSLTPMQRAALERGAPERITVPSGSRIALEYAEGQSPVLAVRIQEIFGLQDTPRIAGGRVRVLLHLLAPNHRPQQITDDLASFWSTAYPQIRSELRRRYPKHAWPDNPLTAAPERRPQRRPAS